MNSNLIIKGAKIFDGISPEPRFADIAVAEGKVDKIGENLSQEAAVRIIDASGLWLFPGLMDCLLYTSPSPRDTNPSRMPSSA